MAALPGIGRSTAGAILVFSRGARHPILDGNVKRVLARLFGITGYPGDKRVADRLWQRAEELLPRRGVEAYTQGLMDLGAGVCARAARAARRVPGRRPASRASARLIAAIPGRKPRKALPQKATTMLALTRAGEVLLEKRPPAGIWGGMWSLPEAARDTEIAAILPAQIRRARHRYREASPDRARLYALQAGYISAQAEGRQALAAHAAEPGLVWLPLEEARQAAIPAPVKRILALL